MPITKLTPENNYPYLQDRLEAFEQAVPEAFTDGKINWDTLRKVLGDNLEDEARDEYFGLNWPGKREARKKAATPSRATLVPAPGEGVNEDTTENLFIEGDNLEVLKLLQKSYAGKIKMIYIDPPYNTGNDFIYNDNFTDPLEAYLNYTGARGESGELLTTNTRADGRFHSKWLNMMYPRLILARQLLREDGVIFVSIDDNEAHNLRQIMNEIFGEENFIATVIWQKKYTRSNDANWFSDNHDYILVFAQSKTFLSFNLQPRNEDQLKAYSNPDNHLKGPWKATPLHAKSGSNNNFSYQFKNGVVWSPPPGTFPRFSRETLDKLDQNNEIWFGSDGKSIPSRKTFLSEAKDGVTPVTIWPYDEVGHTHEANNELKDLSLEGVFENPKPTKLIKRMLELVTTKDTNDIVLDFFAGSASTANAIIDMNNQDQGNRKFILIQIPEKTDKKDFFTISDISKDRIRRVIKNTKENPTSKDPIPSLFEKLHTFIDHGFKVFVYTRSNFKQWKPQQEESVETLTPLFDNLSDPLVQGWKKQDLLSEILLLEGFPLTSKITYLEDHLKNEVYRVSVPDFCAHDLFVCLDETIQPATVELLTMEKEDIFICLDSALSDELKARVQDQFNVHVI